MKIEKVLKILVNKKIVKSPEFRSLGAGNNYQAFLVNDFGKQYVLRLMKSSVASKNRLEKAYIVSKFIEKENIGFAQKAIFFDKKNKFLLTDYIDGQEFSVKDLNQKHLKEFLMKMIRVNSLEYKDFGKFTSGKKLNFDILEDSEKRIDSILKIKMTYLKRNKNILFDSSFDKKMDYLKNNLVLLKKEYKDIDWTDKRVFFDHGDLAGANIILNKNNQLFFIDWDNAKFTKDIGLILANMFFYCGDITDSFQKKFISLYIKEGNIKFNAKELKLEVERALKLIILSGIVWALASAIKSKKRSESFWLKYTKIANERLAIYEKHFGADGGTRTHKPFGTRV